MKCPKCDSNKLSFPPQELTNEPVVECGECGWLGRAEDEENERLYWGESTTTKTAIAQ